MKKEKIPDYPSLSWVRGRQKRKSITDPKSTSEVEEPVTQVCPECKTLLKKLKWEEGSSISIRSSMMDYNIVNFSKFEYLFQEISYKLS